MGIPKTIQQPHSRLVRHLHLIVNFIGYVGTMMADTGLAVRCHECAFGGVAHMLTGKRFRQNFRALRIVVEELLYKMVQEIENNEKLLSDTVSMYVLIAPIGFSPKRGAYGFGLDFRVHACVRAPATISLTCMD